MDANYDRAFILRLPDELLYGIVKEACRPDKSSFIYPNMVRDSFRFDHQRDGRERVRMPALLCLVCRRFNRITMPFLYADLVIASDRWGYFLDRHENLTPTTKLLHRSCQANPNLWRLCRVLNIDFGGYTPCGDSVHDWPLGCVASDLTTWLTETRSFRCNGLGHSSDAWTLFLQGMRHFKHLEELSLAGKGYDIDVTRVFRVLNETGCSKLRTLELDGISFIDDKGGSKRPKLEPRTASLTTLGLRNFLATPAILEELMRWTPSLEHFQLSFTYGDNFSELGAHSWSLATLQPILDIHRKTLRSIYISHIDQPGLAGFDMRPFEQLEQLSISACTMHRSFPYRPIDRQETMRLLAPRLRRFHFDLTYEDQQCGETLNDLGYAEESWLRFFARAAIEQKCPLQEIGVTFRPEGWFNGGWCRTCVYPWDRLDALGRELEPEGIRVCYNPPNTSREEFRAEMRASNYCKRDEPCFTCNGRIEDEADTG